MKKVYLAGHLGLITNNLQTIQSELKDYEVIPIGSKIEYEKELGLLVDSSVKINEKRGIVASSPPMLGIEKERSITINEHIQKEKSLGITNPYENLYDYIEGGKPLKTKKPYWKNGKLKYK